MRDRLVDEAVAAIDAAGLGRRATFCARRRYSWRRGGVRAFRFRLAMAGGAPSNPSSRFVQFPHDFVKRRQVLSSFVKDFLDVTFCNFNGLSHSSLTIEPS